MVKKKEKVLLPAIIYHSMYEKMKMFENRYDVSELSSVWSLSGRVIKRNRWLFFTGYDDDALCYLSKVSISILKCAVRLEYINTFKHLPSKNFIPLITYVMEE